MKKPTFADKFEIWLNGFIIGMTVAAFLLGFIKFQWF